MARCEPVYEAPRTLASSMRFQRVRYRNVASRVIAGIDYIQPEVEDWDIATVKGWDVPLTPFSEMEEMES